MTLMDNWRGIIAWVLAAAGAYLVYKGYFTMADDWWGFAGIVVLFLANRAYDRRVRMDNVRRGVPTTRGLTGAEYERYYGSWDAKPGPARGPDGQIVR